MAQMSLKERGVEGGRANGSLGLGYSSADWRVDLLGSGSVGGIRFKILLVDIDASGEHC